MGRLGAAKTRTMRRWRRCSHWRRSELHKHEAKLKRGLTLLPHQAHATTPHCGAGAGQAVEVSAGSPSRPLCALTSPRRMRFSSHEPLERL